MKLLLILLQVMLSQGEPAVVYHMPFTEIALTVEYTKISYEAGPFAQFANELLGIEDAVLETEEEYYLDKITTGSRTTADPNRVIKILPEKGIDLQLLALNENGTLYGYNVVKEEKAPSKSTTDKSNQTKKPKIDVLPLLEDGLEAKTLRDKAVSVQKQIIQLREARMYLLLGESESQPTDGQGVVAMFEEINKQETDLIRMFTGKVTISREKKILYYAPTVSTQAIVARFSKNHGLVDAKEEGTPISILIFINRPQLEEPAEETTDGKNSVKKDKKAPLPCPICYNIPASATYHVQYGEKEMVAERKISVAQLGLSVPFNRDLFKVRCGTHILINRKTGNIDSITRE